MKNKLSFLFILTSIFIYSQDIIHKKNGERINSKIISISSSEITYKNSEDLNTPNYSISTKEVYKIQLETGKEELFGKFESLQAVKDSIVNKINKHAIDINDSYKTVSATFEDNILTLTPVRYNGKLTKSTEKWDLSKIVKIHNLSVRDRNIAYVNIVCYKIKNDTSEIKKLVLKINDHQIAEEILRAIEELQIMLKK